MEDNSFKPFSDRVQQAIETSDFTSVLTYLSKNSQTCAKDPTAIQRLLNGLSRLNLTEQIQQVFSSLLKVGFIFDSIQYVNPLSLLIEQNKTVTQLSVLNQLIKHKVTIDTGLIQKALSVCFDSLKEELSQSNQEQLWQSIIQITHTVLLDCNNYVTLDFMIFIIRRLLENGRQDEVEKILMNQKLSEQQYPDIWTYYIQSQAKEHKYEQLIHIIDNFKNSTVSKSYHKLFNSVLENFVKFNGRNQKEQFKNLAVQILDRGVQVNHNNQIEILLQVYSLKSRSDFIDVLLKMNPILDIQAFNLVYNLILDKNNYHLGLEIYELILDEKLKSVTLEDLNISKSSLLMLLKHQTFRLRKLQDIKLNDDIAISEINFGSQSQIDVYDIEDLIKERFVLEEFKIQEEIQNSQDQSNISILSDDGNNSAFVLL
eukprot:403371843